MKYVCADENVPELYNKDGHRVQMFFLRDIHGEHQPHGGGSPPIVWDRFDHHLKTHFYTHKMMASTVGQPVRKFGWLIESEAIVPEDYQWLRKNPGVAAEFDAVFTFSDALLNRLPNARFCTAGGLWHGAPNSGGTLRDDAYLFKTKNVSMVASHKMICPLQIWRSTLARKLMTAGLADTFGSFDTGRFMPTAKLDSLVAYRYSIAVENDITPYYFTEKILDCFAAMTVPIYLGATKISNFFNPEGIIQINKTDMGRMDKILSQCSEKDYEARLGAVKDNYRRLTKFYMNTSQYLYNTYFNPGGQKTLS